MFNVTNPSFLFMPSFYIILLITYYKNMNNITYTLYTFDIESNI